eukprot:scaffold73918_cov72-Phaeocystis_antarctica.AAC.1
MSACRLRAQSGGRVLGEVLVDPLDLARLVDARPRQSGALPGQLHAVEGLEVVVPNGLGVVLCEEDLVRV